MPSWYPFLKIKNKSLCVFVNARVCVCVCVHVWLWALEDVGTLLCADKTGDFRRGVKPES